MIYNVIIEGDKVGQAWDVLCPEGVQFYSNSGLVDNPLQQYLADDLESLKEWLCDHYHWGPVDSIEFQKVVIPTAKKRRVSK